VLVSSPHFDVLSPEAAVRNWNWTYRWYWRDYARREIENVR